MLSFQPTGFKKFHLLQVYLYLSFGLFFSANSFGVEVSEPEGLSRIGHHLILKSSVAQIPETAVSQLRTTCLKARIYPYEDPTNGFKAKIPSDIFVHFEPTVNGGGVLEFSSAEEVNDAIIELELVSECPLVVFRKHWSLIMDQANEQVHARIQNPENALASKRFDLESSLLLAASRQPPKLPPLPSSSWSTEPASMTIDNEHQGESTKKQNVESTGEAQLDQVADVSSDLLAPEVTEEEREMRRTVQSSDGSRDQVYELKQPVLDELVLQISATVLLLVGLGVLFNKMRIRRRLGVDLHGSSVDPACPVPSVELLQNSGNSKIDKPSLFSSNTQPMSSHRVLESLMGADDVPLDDLETKQVDFSHVNNLHEAERQSLRASLDLVNRSRIRNWVLPDSYMPLVEPRNKSLELQRTVDALLLRCHLGLVELAFQDARIGNSTCADNTAELLEHVLGSRIDDLETKSVLFVPDLVKSHVRAKMCEVSGTENRQLLKENLMSLNSIVPSSVLCFSSISWREFLSEEGILE